MKRKTAKAIKIFFVTVFVLAIFLTTGLSGCKPQTAQEESVVTTVSEGTTAEVAEETEDTAADTTAEEINPDEITGNLNILSGLAISDEVSASRPMAIMVENTPDARPQSGLISADVVFEVVDEYGITRFVAVYSSYDSDLVGPVRSARPYYAEIARSFDPIYVFWGTHPSFYILIENLGLDYLSPLGDETGASSITGNFVDPGKGEGADAIRDTSRDIAYEHTAYVRVPRMREIAANLGYAPDGGQSSFYFKNDASEGDRGEISNITINFSSSTYKVNFEYDSTTNTYLRFCGGSASTDRESGKQITVNNVIVMITDIRNSGDAQGHMIVRTTQSGEAFYLMDGKVIEGTWSRNSALEPFEFKDKDGKTILTNVVQTWVAMISGIEQLEY